METARIWVELALRWFHVIAGVAWIGASFYFNWLNNSIRAPKKENEEIGGHLFAIHGGAFYEVLKYKGAPKEIPKTLHWFKWEAYTTWISGFSLLVVVYYLQAQGNLVDPSVRELSTSVAVGISLGVLLVAWLGYHFLCKVIKSTPILTIVGFVLMTVLAWGLCQTFGSRAAYIHIGAIIGTMMAANVFFVIIPNQRLMVDARIRGEEPDLQKGIDAATRSLHNNYLTLPVLFIMVSGHYPMTYGHPYNWAILAALSLIGATVRHYFNLKGQGHRNVWILPVSAVAMIALALVAHSTQASFQTDAKVGDAEAYAIVQQRCFSCHAKKPTHPAYKFAGPPKGITYESVAEVRARSAKISVVVRNRVMPLGNDTKMTDEERARLLKWIGGSQELLPVGTPPPGTTLPGTTEPTKEGIPANPGNQRTEESGKTKNPGTKKD